MTCVQETRASRKNLQVELDASGVAIESNAKTFQSYLRVYACSHITITVIDWRQVSKQLKCNKWKDIRQDMERLKSKVYNAYAFEKKEDEDLCVLYPYITPKM